MQKIVLIVFATFFLYSQPLALTSDEKALLKSYPMRCIATGTWPPFNTLINGKLAGIGIDLWHKVAERLGIPFDCSVAGSWSEVLQDIKSKKYDLTIAAQKTEDRLKYAVFSEPFARYPYVAVSKKGSGFRLDTNTTVAVGRNYSAAKMLHKLYSKLHIIETDSVESALKMVKSGKVEAAVDVLPVMAFLLKETDAKELEISFRFPEKFSFRIMLRKDYAPILPLINRSINSILNKEEQEVVMRKWEMIKNKTIINPVFIYGALGALLVALAVLFYFIRSLKKEIKNKEKDIKYYEEKASFDSLTLIYNRHMLDTILAQQLAIAQRYRQLLSVIFFDVDDFKVINDTYGHNAGDDVLIELTRLVSSTIRGSDIFGRWGGDEFMIILPESSQKQANRLASILDSKIKNHNFSAVDHLSCSFGVASYQYGDTAKDLLHRVDLKLYEAKKNKYK